MPYETGVDKEGPWIRWGRSGKKYHYRAGNKKSKTTAFEKASRQRRAILATGWKEHGDAKKGTGTTTPEERMRRTIERMKAAGKKFTRRPTYRINYPRRLETDYARQIMRLMKRATSAAAQILIEALPGIIAAYQAEHRTDTKAGNALADAMRSAKAAIATRLREPIIEQAALTAAERIGAMNYREVGKQFISRMGINPIETEPWLQARYEAWVEENVALITSIEPEAFGKVEQVIRNGLNNGETTPDIADKIRERFGVTESRATLIARDQIGKLFGQLTKQRNEQAGVKSFIWHTAGDERVRESHAVLEGEEFTWAEGAVDDQTGETIWPGTAIQCRCTAEAVFEEMEEVAEEEEEA